MGDSIAPTDNNRPGTSERNSPAEFPESSAAQEQSPGLSAAHFTPFPGRRIVAPYVFEAVLLAGLVLVVLLVNYGDWITYSIELKAAALHLTAAVLLSLLLFELALYSTRGSLDWKSVLPAAWLRRDLRQWLFVSVAVYAAVITVSTLLSPLPALSFFGTSPNRVSGELYSQLSMLVIFTTVALKIRSRDQVVRFLYVVVALVSLTSIYGVAQHFKFEPLQPSFQSFGRAQSTFGNPIFFGSFLVMTIPLTMALGLMMPRPLALRWFLTVSIALGLQMAALWFTQSRGPLLGTYATILILAAALLLWSNRRDLRPAAGIVLLAVVIASVLAAMPFGVSSGRPTIEVLTLQGTFDQSSQAALIELEDGNLGEPDPIAYRSGIVGRQKIWTGTLDIVRGWESPAPASVGQLPLRSLFGLGPDMLIYSFPLVASPVLIHENVDNAHNLPLQILVENGWLGLISVITITLVALAILIQTLKRASKRSTGSVWTTTLYLGILAAFAGRIAEQMTGVAQAPDQLLSWMLIGMVAGIGAGRLNLEPAEAHIRPLANTASRRAISGPLIAVAVAVVTLGWFTFIMFDARQVYAGYRNQWSIRHLERTGVLNEQRMLDSNSNAKYVELYHFQYAAAQWAQARARFDQGDPQSAILLARKGYNALAEFELTNPYSINTQILLIRITFDMVLFGDDEIRTEAIERLLRLSSLAPGSVNLQLVAAARLIALDQYGAALEIADRVIRIEASIGRLPRAWWTRGEALVRQGHNNAAIEAFETAILRDEDGIWAQASNAWLAELAGQR